MEHTGRNDVTNKLEDRNGAGRGVHINGRIDGTDWPAGRKRSLTPALVLKLRQALLTGVPKNVAASLCHLAPATLYAWLSTGRRDLARGVLSPEARLLVAVEAAESEFEQQVLGSIPRSSEGGIIKVPVRQADGSPVLDEHGQPQMREVYERPKWEAGAFLLERRDPENWAKKSELQVTHSERPNIAVLTKDEPEKVICLFEQAKTLLAAAHALRDERARQRQEGDAQAALPTPEDAPTASSQE